MNETLETLFESWADQCLPTIPNWEVVSPDLRDDLTSLARLAFYSGAANMYRMCFQAMTLEDEKYLLERWRQLGREVKDYFNQEKP